MIINKRQSSIILFYLSISFMLFTSVNIFTKISINNAILIIVLGSIISYFFISFYINLLKKKRTNILLEIINILVTSIILIFAVNKMTLFISNNLLKNVNTFIILASFILLVYYINHKGIKIMAKTAELFSYIFLIIFILSLISLFQYVDFKSISIINNFDVIKLVKGITSYVILTVAPIYFLFQVTEIEIGEKYLKKYYIISCIYILINLLLVLSILGGDLTNIYINPEITILKKISFLNIIDRMENLFSINMFASGFFFISIAVYVLVDNINKLFKIKKKDLTLSLVIIFLFILSNRFDLTISLYIYLLISLMVIPLFQIK